MSNNRIPKEHNKTQGEYINRDTLLNRFEDARQKKKNAAPISQVIMLYEERQKVLP